MESRARRPQGWWLASLCLVILVWLLFLPVYDNQPVWDDWVNIVRNQEYRGLGFEQLRWAFTQFRMGHYQPLAWLSFSVDYVLWGDHFGGYRLTNIALHSLNVLLFALIAHRLLAQASPGKPSVAGIGSLVAAATFALHPLRVESVAWLTERRQLLGALFALATLWVYLWRVGRHPERRLSLMSQALLSLLFLLSLLATPLAIGLPFVLLVLDLYPLRRRPAVVEKLPLFAVGAVFVWTALAAQYASDALIPGSRYGLSDRLIQAAYSAIFYPRALVATSWSPLYERPLQVTLADPRFSLSLLAFAAITTVVVLTRKRAPALAAVWFSYLILIAPVSGLAQSGIQLVADRYSYLAGLGFCLLLGWLFSWAWIHGSRPLQRVLWAGALILLLVFWSWSTYRQNGVWHDDIRLWSHVAEHGPSAMAENNLGAELQRRTQYTDAVRHFRNAIEIAPSFGRPWLNLRRLFERQGLEIDPEVLSATVSSLEEAIEYQAHTATGWYILGLAHARSGDPSLAEADFRRALEIKPDLAAARFELGIALMTIGRRADAASEFNEFLRLEPDHPKARRWLEAALSPPDDPVPESEIPADGAGTDGGDS